MVELNIQLDLKKLQTQYSNILGCWDRSLPKTNLGSLLIFLSECQLIIQSSNAKSVDIALNASSHQIENVLEGQYSVFIFIGTYKCLMLFFLLMPTGVLSAPT